MTEKKKILLVVLLSVFACAAIIAIGITALFADDSFCHLRANRSGLRLVRTDLDCLVLDESTGFLKRVTSGIAKDFSYPSPSADNIFDLTKRQKIVPGVVYEATLCIIAGDGAEFSYWVEFRLDNDMGSKKQGDALPKQLIAAVGVKGGKTLSERLSEGGKFGSRENALARVGRGESGEFTVKLEFADDDSNNAVKEQFISFDIVVFCG